MIIMIIKKIITKQIKMDYKIKKLFYTIRIKKLKIKKRK